MSLRTLLVHDIAILRPALGSNRYGDASKDWGTASETDTVGWIARRNESEDRAEGREAQISEWVLYLDAGADIQGGDRVVWGTTTFEVDGPPNPARTPRGVHHIEANLRLVEG
jgi:hypothetical protein